MPCYMPAVRTYQTGSDKSSGSIGQPPCAGKSRARAATGRLHLFGRQPEKSWRARSMRCAESPLKQVILARQDRLALRPLRETGNDHSPIIENQIGDALGMALGGKECSKGIPAALVQRRDRYA